MDNMVKRNPHVGSVSRCETCHKGFDRGDFDEQGFRSADHGRWED
jgi:hypothetical protein